MIWKWQICIGEHLRWKRGIDSTKGCNGNFTRVKYRNAYCTGKILDSSRRRTNHARRFSENVLFEQSVLSNASGLLLVLNLEPVPL